MKLILIVLLCLLSFVRAMCQSSIYDLSIKTSSGKNISLSDYKGKKILIASISQDNLDKKDAFYFWDSLKKNNPLVVVIIIPANDFGSEFNAPVKASITSASPENIILASATLVKKDKSENQNSIMRWLTNVNENSHFNVDVNSDNQIYVISESGVLYAVLEKGVPVVVIGELLKQEDVKQ